MKVIQIFPCKLYKQKQQWKMRMKMKKLYWQQNLQKCSNKANSNLHNPDLILSLVKNIMILKV